MKSACNVQCMCIVYGVKRRVWMGRGGYVWYSVGTEGTSWLVHAYICVCVCVCVCVRARALKVSTWGLIVCLFVTSKKFCIGPFLSSNFEAGIKLLPVAIFSFYWLQFYLQNFPYISAVCYKTHIYTLNCLAVCEILDVFTKCQMWKFMICYISHPVFHVSWNQCQQCKYKILCFCVEYLCY
jgi:hypothetical protein